MGIYFGTDGFRGVYGEILSPEIAYKVGNSLGSLCQKKKIIIGTDTRRTGSILSLSFSCGIMSCGVDVINVGIVPTPVIAFLTKKLKADYGVMITASHNPKNYNGIKIFDENGFKINENIEAIIERKLLYSTELSSEKVGRFQNKNRLICHYKNKILSNLTSLSGLKIVLDMANGASYNIAKELFSKLNAKIIALNYGKNGKKINYKCGALYPDVISNAVKKYNADLGFAFDGDADRIIACNEKGEILDGDDILFLLSSRLPANSLVVGTSMTNRGFENALKERGLKLIRSDVGDKYVVEKMKSVGAVLGGEPSGHIIDFNYSTTGDGVLTALTISQLVKNSGKPLSKLTNLKHYPQIMINVDVVDKFRILNSEQLTNSVLLLQKQFGNEGRLLIRASGTENKIRIMCEHKNKKIALSSANELENLIKNIEKSYKK